MQGIFITLAWGLLALIGVSVLVALLEYVRSARRPFQPPLPAPPPRAVSIDLDLDRIDADAGGDQSQRQAAVGQALARMAQGAATTPPASDAEPPWIETLPTVLTGHSSTAADTSTTP